MIPGQGSVGASGDLAPLAHLAMVAIGEGEAVYEGRRVAGGHAMKAAGITPLALEAKEGLAMLNGTQGMLALLSLALRDAEIATDTADVGGSVVTRCAAWKSGGRLIRGSRGVRPYPGHATTARNLQRLNEGSAIRDSHKSMDVDPRVQDAYSLRCTPQVHGSVRDVLDQVDATLSVELNSATDNPLVFATDDRGAGDVVSGGNFHGQPLAIAADQLAVALTTLAGISERRIEQMTNPQTSLLPAFLVRDAGAEFGIYDFAGDGGGAGERDEGAVHTALGGFDSDVGEPRGLRFDGDERVAPAGADDCESTECAGD